MIKLIILIFPSILAVGIAEKLEKKKYPFKEWLYNFAYYIIMIQLLISLILSTLFNASEIFLNYNQYTNLVVVKYLVISLILSLVVPFLSIIVKNNFSLSFNIQKQKRGK